VAGTAQPMRYTGKILDGENGLDLYYYGARYHAPDIGAFTQIDPHALRTPGWSPYVYTLDNPLKYTDPDGGRTEVYSIPIGSGGLNTGYKHLFIRVHNEKLGLNTSRGYYPKSRFAATLNAVTPLINISSGNEIELRSDLTGELGEVMKLETGEESNATLEAIIGPSEGMSEDELDKAVLKTTENIDLNGIDYDIRGPNSNTMVDNVIEATGATIPKVKGAKGQDYGETPKPYVTFGMPPRAME